MHPESRPTKEEGRTYTSQTCQSAMLACDPMSKASPEDYREWTRRYVSQRQERGEKQTTVWVPANRIEELKAFAARLRIEEGLEKEQPPKPPKVVVPQLDIPASKPPGWSYLRVAEDELALRMIVKANGGEWIRGNLKVDKTWKLRTDLVAKLGLQGRVVHEKKTWPVGAQDDLEEALCA